MSKKDSYIGGFLFVIQAIVVLLIGISSNNHTFFWANLFYDRLFVFILVPMYMFGIAVIEKYMNCFIMVRIGNRKNGMMERLKRQYYFGFVFWTVWFSIILVATGIFFESVESISWINYWGSFLKYFLGSVMISNLLIILKSSNNKFLSENSYITVYLLLAVELLVIVPEIKIQTPLECLFLFSWILYGEYLGGGVLVIYNILLLGYIFRISIRKDMI